MPGWRRSVILTAGIDLSVGAIMILASIIMGKLSVQAGVPVPVAFLLGLAAGAACGAINGLIVTFLRLPPFIVTLGTWNVFGATFLWYSASQTIRAQEVAAEAVGGRIPLPPSCLSWLSRRLRRRLGI